MYAAYKSVNVSGMDFCDKCDNLMDDIEKHVCDLSIKDEGEQKYRARKDDMEEELREKWEKEQDEQRKNIILKDVDDWAKFRLTPESVAPDSITPDSVAPDSVAQATARPLELVGGVDVSFVKGDDVNACAALVVVSFPSLEVVYEDCVHIQLTAPYIPGFLAFREADFILERVAHLKATKPHLMPQVILVDGNGILHPRGVGLACHLGVELNMPCAGVAKKLFQVDGLEKNTTHTDRIKQLEKGGDTFALVGDSGDVLGMALRSCDSSRNPVYVSQGHMISLETAVWVVHQCCKHRVPEPVRQADQKSREFLRVHIPEKLNTDQPGN